ncbi:CDP-archaeol synthase [Bermanella marisrubri]|uniref:Phosphatidate cytidylyltransferase n=1 Tax=Bermanella marisrubri TaxID=207949 RepID=Q1N1W9_9GAMM|nr:CDP-archaeol synthase [Bermanella marisrubri]EAT12162.1 phosphatidate cytidylyltransferase [Oceanobacter sp. RED65] [Bermanella marisrubri]QIZ83638.1 CDP-archaeol synthase [Bermanella marisrubri]
MLKQRIITALILAPIMIGGIFFLPLSEFMVFIGLITAIGGWEWAKMSGLKAPLGRIAYAGLIAGFIAAIYLFDQTQEESVLYVAAVWWLLALILVITHPRLESVWQSVPVRLLIGLLVLIPMWVGFVQIKSYPYSNFLILFVMLVVWGADVGAYFAGRTFGKHKLAPKVSPGKTWEGVYGGLLTTALIAWFGGQLLQSETNIQLDVNQWLMLFAITFVVTIVSVVGDLLESMMKRHCGMKDSSNLLPGHGGVMDRIDSMTAALPVFALALSLFGWNLIK